MQVKLINSHGKYIYQPLGLAIHVLYFAPWVFAYRRDWKFLGITLASVALSTFAILTQSPILAAFGGFTLFLLVIALCFGVFHYNTYTAKRLLYKGYLPTDKFGRKVLQHYGIESNIASYHFPDIETLPKAHKLGSIAMMVAINFLFIVAMVGSIAWFSHMAQIKHSSTQINIHTVEKIK